MNTRTSVVTSSLLAAGLLAAGCQSTASDRAASASVRLNLATTDGAVENGGPAIAAFVDGLREISGGQLQVEVSTDHGDGAADAEAQLVRAIASGDLDGGWPATRAFAAAGVHGLEAVEAPMTITSYDAQRELVTGPLGEELLDQLEGTGVIGLGLAIAPLRRPLAAEGPLLAASDWEGARFRVYGSPTQEGAVRALGATPVQVTHAWHEELRSGSLRGAEVGIDQNLPSSFSGDTYVTSNVVLWPKVFVLSLSQRRFDAMTDEQRAWVREAAERAVRTSVDLDHEAEEAAVAARLCGRGVSFVEADEAELDSLRARFEPYVAELAATSEARSLLERIQALASEHAGPDVLAAPQSCDGAPTEAVDFGEVPATQPALPDGVYRTEITLEDVEAAGQSNDDGWTGTWTLTIADGIWHLSCRPLGGATRDCGGGPADVPLEAGQVRGADDTLYLVGDPEALSQLTGCELPPSEEPGHCYTTPSHRMSWSLEGERLTFGAYASDEPGHVDWIYLLAPWQRIG